MRRLREPSTWAGIGLICTGMGQLLANGGGDGAAWGTIAAGVVAVLKHEPAAR